ncbi:MAG: hypothetical protein JXR46_10000 [Calditrichaceae bacterium]|nr:hypothetical protein [Calditrichaceae bacterium]MBN2709367.1 hypothetical protein [Calditrichaceae bacterium]
MSKIKSKTILILLALLTIMNLSFADSLAFSGDMTLVSTYVWRGIKQYDGLAMHGTVQGAYKFVSVGVWFSTVNFGEGSPVMETDPYIAVSLPTGDIETSVGMNAYMYDFTRFGVDTSGKDILMEYELYASFAYNIFGLSAYFVPGQKSTESEDPESKYWLELSGTTSLGSFDWSATLGYGTYSSRWLATPKKEATGNLVISAAKKLTDDLSVNWNCSLGIDNDMDNYLWAGLSYGF